MILAAHELAYLIRCVERDLEEFEAANWQGDMDESAMLEATRGDMVLRLLKRAEQEQAVPH